MSDGLRFNEAIGFNVNRKRDFEDNLNFKGRFPKVQHIRDGKVIAEYDFPNAVTNAGKDYILNAGFNGGTQVTGWVIGLLDNTSFSALAATDTMASHAGWIEFQGYSQANRVPWGQSASSGQSVSNGTPATFNITAVGTVAGIFVVSQNTKGGTIGTLWTEGLFPAPVPVAIGDAFTITYQVAC